MIGGSLTKLGLVLVVAGALLMAGPVFGFSTISADRGVSVGTAEDPEALLGIMDNSGTTSADIHPSTGQEGDVFFLNDNAGHFSVNDISADVLAFNGATTALTASVETADDNNDFVVHVRCGDSTLNDAGQLTVQLTAESAISLELKRTTMNQIDVQCSGNSGSGGPTADAGGSYTTYEGENIQLDGTGSTTRTGTIQDYTWELVDGDGSLEYAGSTEPTYVAPNNLAENMSVTVELAVTNNKGNTDTDIVTITVHEGS